MPKVPLPVLDTPLVNLPSPGGVSCLPKSNSCEVSVAKPNYSFEKRQRELEKKKKKEEKNQRKLTKGSEPETQAVESPPDSLAPVDASVLPGNA